MMKLFESLKKFAEDWKPTASTKKNKNYAHKNWIRARWELAREVKCYSEVSLVPIASEGWLGRFPRNSLFSHNY